jgi:hypothetical protein
MIFSSLEEYGCRGPSGRPCAAQERNRDDFYSIIRWDLVDWLVGLIDCLKICSMLTD